jgi:hypothetical protein
MDVCFTASSNANAMQQLNRLTDLYKSDLLSVRKCQLCQCETRAVFVPGQYFPVSRPEVSQSDRLPEQPPSSLLGISRPMRMFSVRPGPSWPTIPLRTTRSPATVSTRYWRPGLLKPPVKLARLAGRTGGRGVRGPSTVVNLAGSCVNYGGQPGSPAAAN